MARGASRLTIAFTLLVGLCGNAAVLNGVRRDRDRTSFFVALSLLFIFNSVLFSTYMGSRYTKEEMEAEHEGANIRGRHDSESDDEEYYDFDISSDKRL
mmetsp:Transcript_25114/g.70365  ORF Transcript_25114/g.70365 Transcript_25114/m.70365 type:complete len:99 (+) Transcript_25114:121-417(+)